MAKKKKKKTANKNKAGAKTAKSKKQKKTGASSSSRKKQVKKSTSKKKGGSKKSVAKAGANTKAQRDCYNNESANCKRITRANYCDCIFLGTVYFVSPVLNSSCVFAL